MKNDARKKYYFVLDTSVIITITNLGLLEKLCTYAHSNAIEIMIPDLVHKELNHPTTSKTIKESIKKVITRKSFKLLHSRRDITKEIKFRYLRLGDGEIGVLASALDIKFVNKPAIVFFDDKLAKKAAKELNIPAHGTLWLIYKLTKEKLITVKSAIRMFKELPNHGFFIAKETLNDFIHKIQRTA